MEFCGDQCTLEKISKETSGLPEKIVRVYTKSLLEAVATLRNNLLDTCVLFLLFAFFRKGQVKNVFDEGTSSLEHQSRLKQKKMST